MTAVLDMWWAWRKQGVMPVSGGWRDQPLSLMAQLSAFEMVYNLSRILSLPEDKVDWKQVNITANQMEIKAWLDDEES